MEPEEQVKEAGERVERTRTRLDVLVSELDQRRHFVSGAKKALKDNVWLAPVLGIAGITAVAGIVALVVQHHNERQRLRSRAARFRRAMARMIDNPDRVASSGSTVPGKIAAAGGSAVVTILVKRLLADVASNAPEKR